MNSRVRILVSVDVHDCAPAQLRARFIGAIRAGVYRAHRDRRIDSGIAEELMRALSHGDSRR